MVSLQDSSADLFRRFYGHEDERGLLQVEPEQDVDQPVKVV
jgi:hypothetical protein